MTTAPRMRRDIKPLCPTHHAEMALVDVEEEKYSCAAEGCTVSWRAVREYQRFAGDAIEEQEPEPVSCPRVGHGRMFISRFDSDGNIETWRCSIENCSQEEDRLVRGWELGNRYRELEQKSETEQQ